MRLETIPLLAALISAVSAGISLLSFYFVTKFAMKNYDREIVNQRMNFIFSQQKYFEDLRKWSDELSDILSEALHLCDLDPAKITGESFFDRRHRMLIKLSSMIDRGRWFFPNIHSETHKQNKLPETHRQNKPSAFRGHRHEIIESLVLAYRYIRKLDHLKADPNRTHKDELIKYKQSFISEMQIVLNPRLRDAEFKQLTRALPQLDVKAPSAAVVAAPTTVDAKVG